MENFKFNSKVCMFKGEGMKRSVSGTVLILLLMAMLSLSFNFKSTKAEWTGTVYIRADGRIDSPGAPIITYDNVTYTLTGNITSNADGIVVERDNIIIDGAGFWLKGPGQLYSHGIVLDKVVNVTITNVIIRNFGESIYLYQATDNLILENDLEFGISLNSSSNNRIVKNNITSAAIDGAIWHVIGIKLVNSSNNTIVGNNIKGHVSPTDPTIYMGEAIMLFSSSNNNVFTENTMINNQVAVDFFSWYGKPSNNRFFHNNFIENNKNVIGIGQANTFDDGYPSGGNYWSDYNGTDLYSGPYQNETGSDGMGDTPYVIDANNIDRYPLMAPFKVFEAQHWDGLTYNFHVISNSTILNFELFESLIPEIPSKISLNVSGPDNANGFCRITIPNIIVQDLWQNNYMVLLNGEPYPFKNWTDSENTYIYINYTHSTHEIVIIPEYPSTIILTIFMLTTTILLVLTRNRRLKHRRQFC